MSEINVLFTPKGWAFILLFSLLFGVVFTPVLNNTMIQGASASEVDPVFTEHDAFDYNSGYATIWNASGTGWLNRDVTTLFPANDNDDVTVNGTVTSEGITAVVANFSYVDKTEIAEPDTPSADTLRLFVADEGGFSKYYYKDELGIVRSFNDDEIIVKNVRGTTIAAHRLVYVTGNDAGIPTVDLAKADSIDTMPCVGVTVESIANNAYGRVMQVGQILNVNTNSYEIGVIYVSDATAGIPTNTAPVTPSLTQEVGTILVKDATVGKIQIISRALTGDEFGTINDFKIRFDGIVEQELYANKSIHCNETVNALFFEGSGANLTGLVDGDPFYNESDAFNYQDEWADGWNATEGWWNRDGTILYPTTDGDSVTINSSMDIIHTSTESDDHAFEVDVDAAGYGDVKAIDIAYITGAISTGEDEGIILVNIDNILATGGDIFGLEILATEGGSGIYSMKTGAGVGVVHQDSGSFANPTTGTDNTLSTDVPAMIDGNVGTTTAIFENDNEYILIGAASAFEEIEFILTTDSSNPGIKPTFGYSTSGSHQFTTFTPVDGTNGFRNTGVVAWDQGDLSGHTTNDDTGTYDIKITRTQNTMVTTPVLGYAKGAATTEYVWDENGDLSVNNVVGAGSVTGNTYEGNGSNLDGVFPWFNRTGMWDTLNATENNPFDQELNTTDDISAKSITVNKVSNTTSNDLILEADAVLIGGDYDHDGNTKFGGMGSASNSIFRFTTFSTGTHRSYFQFLKSDSDTIGVMAETDSGDSLGYFEWRGVDSVADGQNADYGAFIRVQQNAASGTKVPCDMEFHVASNSATREMVTINYNAVGFLDSTPLSNLTVDINGICRATGGFWDSSDYRIKENFSNVDNDTILSLCRNLNLYLYNYKDFITGDGNQSNGWINFTAPSRWGYGPIAQEIYNQLVNEFGEGIARSIIYKPVNTSSELWNVNNDVIQYIFARGLQILDGVVQQQQHDIAENKQHTQHMEAWAMQFGYVPLPWN